MELHPFSSKVLNFGWFIESDIRQRCRDTTSSNCVSSVIPSSTCSSTSCGSSDVKFADSAAIIYIEDDINDENLSEVKTTRKSTKIETITDCNEFTGTDY